MHDPRLKVYREAALAMAEGAYRQDLPPGPADDVGRLGEALTDLGRILDQRSADLLTLPRLTERINAGQLPDEVLDKAYRALRTLVPYDRLALSLLDRDARALAVRWVRSEAPQTFLDAGAWFPVAGSGLEDVLATRQPRIFNDLPGHLVEHPRCEAVRLLVAEGMRSQLACPLIARNRAVGLLGFSSMAPGAYKRSHQVLLGQLAGPLALIIEKSLRHQDLLERADLRGRLLAGAGPALGAPLEAVLGLLEQLDAEGPAGLDEAARDRVRRALAGQAELRGRLRALEEAVALDAAGPDLECRPADLRGVLDGVLAALREVAAARAVGLEALDAAGDTTVPVDARRLGRALEILAGQLLGRSGPGGRLLFACRGLDHHVQVRIAAPDPLPAPTALAGTGPDEGGAGLVLARRIVAAHGGHLQAEGGPEAAAAFCLWLPR